MGKDAKKEKQEKQGRKLTKAEVRRLDLFRQLEAEMIQAGYVKKDLTATALKANVVGIVYGGILAAVFMTIYGILGGGFTGTDSFLYKLLFALVFIALVVVHELIHGVTWGAFVKGGFKKNIEFGFIAEYLTPYCACKKPLKREQYVVGLIMPCIVLGILPCVLAVILQNGWVLGMGVLNILGAGGDLLVTQMILTHKIQGTEALFLDHPTEIGLVTFEK